MQCGFLHILNFPACIVHRFMYCIFLHVLCIHSCLIFPAYIAYWFIYCVLIHVLRIDSCIALGLMSCVLFPYIPLCFMNSKSHFGHISSFFKFYIQNFFVLRINNLYFPFLLDIKSPTSLIYVQFSPDSIPFSPALSLILDISCHFLFFISNSYPAQFFFHLHRSWLWTFPTIFS